VSHQTHRVASAALKVSEVTPVLKLLLAPVLVVGSSVAGRRWGPAVAGTLAGLPIVAGPILLIICLEEGARFGARAASSALLGLVSLALFAVVFAWCGRRLGRPGSLLIAWVLTLAADFGLARIPMNAFVGLVVVLILSEVAGRLLPRSSLGPGAERPISDGCAAGARAAVRPREAAGSRRA
jgi:hypothetical protein